MPDTLTEFSSDAAIGYTDLIGSGQTIVTTTSGQTAVIRDIDIDNPNGKNLQIEVDDIAIAETSSSGTLTGTTIIPASKTVKLKTTEAPVWTEIRHNKSSGDPDQGFVHKIKSSYWTPPTDGSFETGSRADYNYSSTGANLHTLQNVNDSSGEVMTMPADHLFGKPEGDLYFMDRSYNGRATSNKNCLNYFDYSANSASQLVTASSSYIGWRSGYSNRYLVRPQNDTHIANYQYWDTVNNTLTSKNCVNPTSGSGSHAVYNYHKHVGGICCLDNYMMIRRRGNGGSRSAALVDITTGKTTAIEMSSDWDVSFRESSSTYWHHHAPPQIVKNKNGEYFCLWMFTAGSNSTNHGLQIISLGTNPADTIDAAGDYVEKQYANDYFTMTKFISNGTTGFSSVGWTAWRLYDSETNHDGWGSGWCPMSQLSPTNSYSQYWLYMNAEFAMLIDIDNPTNDPVKVMPTEGGSNPNSIPSSVAEAWSWHPYNVSSTIAGGFGNIKCRVSGVLST